MSDNLGNMKMTRRQFLVRAIGAGIAVVGASVATPLIGYFFSPTYRKKTNQVIISLISTSKIPAGTPIFVTYQATVPDGWITEPENMGAWVVTTSGKDFTVFNPHCPHLGCLYGWNPGLRRFECPCHGSVFDINGRVISGPSALPLQKMPFKISNGVIQLIQTV